MAAAALAGRIAVVTGASRGIGRAAAAALGAAGAHVFAIARTVGGLEELDDEIKATGGSATLVPLDLADFPAIDRLGGVIHERFGKVDMLLGNAAMLGQLSPTSHIEPKVWNETVAINLTANWRLIRSFDPLLRQSDAGRALFVTSGVARRLPQYYSLYSATKAALEAMVRTWAVEIAETSVRANLFNPGPVRTRMLATAMPGLDMEQQTPPEMLAPDIVRLLSPDCMENGRYYNFRDRGFLDD
jgi:NAD(P)-dependent dehydrogenase (short-subunit alcohol dehydrogenase family)